MSMRDCSCRSVRQQIDGGILNEMFGRYINTVLPSMGEHNPQVFTWDSFLKALGLADHASGAHNNPDSLKKLDKFYPRSFNIGIRRDVYE